MLLSAPNAHIDSACIRVWQSALPPTSNLHTCMINALPCPSIARAKCTLARLPWKSRVREYVGERSKEKKKKTCTRNWLLRSSMESRPRDLSTSLLPTQMPVSDADSRSSLFPSNCYRFDVPGPVSDSYISVYTSQAYRGTCHFVNILVWYFTRSFYPYLPPYK